MIDRLRHTPWASLLFLVAFPAVLLLGFLEGGLELVQYMTAAGDLSDATESAYILGFALGAAAVDIVFRVIRIEWVKTRAIPGWVFLETIHWPLGGDDS